jgi:hypothetical protein
MHLGQRPRVNGYIGDFETSGSGPDGNGGMLVIGAYRGDVRCGTAFVRRLR